MDEAALCEQIALIQGGRIMSIDTPAAIRTSFPKPLFAVKTENFYALINDLRGWDQTLSAFSFGEFVHLTAHAGDLKSEDIVEYLRTRGHQEPVVQPVEPTVEDSFMYLMLNKENEQ